MGINLRLLQIAALAVGTVLCVPANAQYERWQEHHDRDEGKSGAYQDGYRDGMRDGEAHRRGAGHNNRWKTGHERHDYDSGYNAGFQAGEARRAHETARDHDRDRGHEFGGNPVGGPQHGGSQAARIGSEDGMMDGQKDRRTGHSFRPTQGDNYKSATRGYYSSMGSKDQYKQEYRRTYAEAYQRGYYGR